MKKIKILIIVLILLVFIVITSILFLVNVNKSNIEEIYEESSNERIYMDKNSNDKSIDTEVYFDIYNCLLKYMDLVNTDNYIYQFTNNKNEYMSSKIYDVLSNQYINKNNITNKNAIKYIKTVDKKCIVIPIQIKTIQKDEIYSFLVYGVIVDTSSYKAKDSILTIININPQELSFSIEPISGSYSNIDDININTLETKIVLNKENKYNTNNVVTEMIIREYINRYKYLSLAYPEKAYEYLDKEYREKRFGSVENFKKYVSENRQEIIGITLQEYQVNDKNTYKEYVGKDKNGNLYIINEVGVLNYTMKLDTYTIETEKFKTEYNKANTQKKVMMNIDKFFQMINAKDYTNAYNCLADSFKNNYFKTEASFKTYIQNNFYKYNDVKYKVYNDKISGVYGYELIINDRQDTSKTKIFNIIIKLKENTDFEVSFEV